MADVFRSLCIDFVRVADALDGGKPSAANQGQALDGFSALANFRALADVARKELARHEPVQMTEESLARLKEVFSDSITRPWHVQLSISLDPSPSIHILCEDIDQQDIDYLTEVLPTAVKTP